MKHGSWLRMGSMLLRIGMLCAVACSALAQEAYPSRPIRIVVAFSAGSGVDALTRLVSEPLSKELGTTISIENRDGASGMLGAGAVASAKPDGYTVLMATQAITTSIHMVAAPAFDPVRDFAPIVKVAEAPSVLFTARDAPFKDFQALVTASKAKPGQLTYATSGPGGLSHLSTKVLERRFGFDARDIPYKANGQAMIDTSTGQVSFALANIPIAIGLLTTGALRPLATGSKKRMSALPQTPTFAELLGDPNFEVGAWYGFVVPTGTPPPVIARLREAIIKVLAEPALRQQVEKALGGGTVEIEDTAKFQARIRSEKESYAKLIAELGLTPK